MDLPHELRPTGRASNGYNVADAICAVPVRASAHAFFSFHSIFSEEN
jgi:hypothetical protein